MPPKRASRRQDSVLLLSQQYVDSEVRGGAGDARAVARPAPGAGDERVYGNSNARALRKLRGLVSMHYMLTGEL